MVALVTTWSTDAQPRPQQYHRQPSLFDAIAESESDLGTTQLFHWSSPCRTWQDVDRYIPLP